MSDFKQAFQKLIPEKRTKSEEEKVESYRGIRRLYYPRWAGWQIIDKSAGMNTENKLTMLESCVKEFYKSNFWDQLGCDSIKSQSISESLFGLSINCGGIIANEYLKKAVDIINGNKCIAKEYPFEYKIDDSMLEMLNHGIQNKHDDILIKILNGYQISFYLKLFEMNPASRSCYDWFRKLHVVIPVSL